MKFTAVASDAFEKLQLNAGILLTDFDVETGDYDREDIFGATSGGTQFTASHEFVDFGDDIDNVPANTKQLKVLQSVTATMSGTLKTIDTKTAKALMAAADVRANGEILPRADLLDSDFFDLWWVGDYSDVNTGNSAGYIAIKLINALSTGGFSLQSNDKGKGDYSFEFTGHYDINDISVIPYKIYIVSGDEDDASLSALSVGTATLHPTFSSETLSYTASVTTATSTITATATDSNAEVVIKNNGTALSGTTATWTSGDNTLTIEVTNGEATKTYTVIVTKS